MDQRHLHVNVLVLVFVLGFLDYAKLKLRFKYTGQRPWWFDSASCPNWSDFVFVFDEPIFNDDDNFFGVRYAFSGYDESSVSFDASQCRCVSLL